MNSMDNFRERIEALEQQTEQLHQQTRMVERRLRWWHSPWSVAAVVALGLILAGVQPAQAKTFQCGAGDVQCLIDAINTANANGEKNTIRLEAGTYILTTVDNTTDAATGLPSITSMLTIRGAGAATTILERAASAPAFRLLHVAAAGALTLKGLTARGGFSSPLGGPGGISNAGTLFITRSAIVGNRGEAGGGLFNTGAATIIQSTIARNSAFRVGGGIANFASPGVTLPGVTLLIANSAIVDNDSTAFDADGGGGIANFGHGSIVVLIHNSTLARNSAPRVGPFCDFSGGAISNGGFASDGLFATVTLTNSTLAENDACSGGGGIANRPPSTVTLQNTLLAHNTADLMIGSDCSGPVTSLDNNLIGDPTGCTITLQPSDLTGDPGLDAFTDDGTPGNGHFPLLPTSQAIDAGNDAVCPRTDQLGRLRIGPCDIGAIEFRHRDQHQHDEEEDHHDQDLAAQ